MGSVTVSVGFHGIHWDDRGRSLDHLPGPTGRQETHRPPGFISQFPVGGICRNCGNCRNYPSSPSSSLGTPLSWKLQLPGCRPRRSWSFADRCVAKLELENERLRNGGEKLPKTLSQFPAFALFLCDVTRQTSANTLRKIRNTNEYSLFDDHFSPPSEKIHWNC